MHEPHYNEKLVRGKIERPNDTGQAGDTYRSFEEWEKEELISNLTEALKVCQPHIQEKMIEHFTHADKDYGRRKSESLAKAMANQKRNHTSTDDADQAADKAQKMGHEADPY